MNSLPIYNQQAIKDFLLPEEIQIAKEIKRRPVVSVKINSEKEQNINRQNNYRTAWHFLTLGIPLLIESLSLFFSSLVHREKLNSPLKVRFRQERLSFGKNQMLIKFHQFNQISFKPLNKAACNKGLQLMLRLVNKLEEAKVCDDCQSILKYKKKLNTLSTLLEKNAIFGITRSHLKEQDWEMVDKIDYQLAQEHFNNLTELFNTQWLSTSTLRKELQREFEFDYQEAVTAEGLVLSLAYIEGIAGKTITLPIFDKVTQKYHAIPFTIKQTIVGDALPCYILECEDPQINPWMIVRGSQPCIGVSSNNREYRQGGFESILADALDPECISRNVVNKALISHPIVELNGKYIQTESLSEIFRKWRNEGKFVNLAGHSLGGTIVNALAVEFPEQIKTAYAFSAAGVSNKTADRWLELNRRNPELNAKLINFDYEGDIVPSGGRRLIGNHLAIQALNQTGSNGIYDCHLRTHLNNDFQIQKIDIAKETHHLTRLFCERLRIIVGHCFHALLWFFGKEYVPDWWKNRKLYCEGAQLERRMRLLL